MNARERKEEDDRFTLGYVQINTTEHGPAPERARKSVNFQDRGRHQRARFASNLVMIDDREGNRFISSSVNQRMTAVARFGDSRVVRATGLPAWNIR